MSGFISRAACHGRRPASHVSHTAYERSVLSANLLKERDVARFIVAPDGYGKTALALEYAETVFSWKHVFWVNAQSPCFIRDLDAGDIASACMGVDAGARLVVFDDLPQLDPGRMRMLSGEIDALLESGCEVVVTCRPGCDMVGGLQRDRVRIGAWDLLLDDAELGETRTADELARKPIARIGPASRVPALAWAVDEEAPGRFAKSALGEEMPLELLLVVASALVLQSGTVSDILRIGQLDKSMLVELLRDHPHIGFDEEFDRFEASPLEIDALAAPLKSKLSDLASRSSRESAADLAFGWADDLVRMGKAGRACELVRGVCPRRMRTAWLIDRCHTLFSQACFFPVFQLARDLDSARGEMRVQLGSIEALCRMVLGDEEGALSCAKSHAFDLSAPLDARIRSLLVAVRLGKGAFAAKVGEALEAQAASASVAASTSARNPIDWLLLARAWSAGRRGPLELARLWGEGLDNQAGNDELCVIASWLFSLLGEDQPEVAASAEVRRCERYVRSQLQTEDGVEPSYFAVSAGLSLEDARGRGVRGEGGLLEASALIQLRRIEMAVLVQRRRFEDEREAARLKGEGWSDLGARGIALATSAKSDTAAQRLKSVPVLTVHLFGHFEAMIGDTPLDSKRFNRRNARTLLVLLTVNQGRELSREAVERAMWPQSTEEVAHKNFYTVWSSLRRALTLPDGTCPYLVRHQYACRLESRLVRSDVDRLSDICRELLFGVPDVNKWSALFYEIDRDFSSDLMPAEHKNRLVVRARNEYRARLVDALVAATRSIVRIDNPQWGVWFARAALEHDETREDAYVALMQAQIAGSQRTAAMMTYLKCRRVLSEQLGIDPSPETTALYESLLDSE